MEKNKPKIRGRFKFSLCKWLRFNNKIYTKNKQEEDNDLDKYNLITLTKPINELNSTHICDVPV